MDWEKLIDVDPPPLGPTTEATRENVKRYTERYRGSVRMALGKFRTDAEHEEHRKKILATPLP